MRDGETHAMQQIWLDWKVKQNPDAKKKLIEHYWPIVRDVASRTSKGMPRNVSTDELISFGSEGLIDAVEKFDPDRALQFETYASLRIRGAIIDGLRQNDWLPRTVREKAKRLEKAYQELEQQKLRSVTDQEMSEFLQVSLDEFHQMLQEVAVNTVYSLHDPIKEGDSEAPIAQLMDDRTPNPDKAADDLFSKDVLAKAIDRLTDKERTVISLRYYEDLSHAEIADVMSLTPPRISQLHTKAILKLRGALDQHRHDLFEKGRSG